MTPRLRSTIWIRRRRSIPACSRSTSPITRPRRADFRGPGTNASLPLSLSDSFARRSCLDFIAQFHSCSLAMTNQPFLTQDNGAFIPTSVANGPWDAKSLHGRVIIGLLAFVIEQRHGGEDFVPARLTVDMFRLPGFAPIEVKTRLIRDGLRIRVVEAEFFSGGASMARASCQLLRKTENAPGNVWSPPNWDVPQPADIAKPTDPRLGMNGKWTTRPITGHMGSLGPRRLWMSEVRELVEGVPMSPFVHVATGADFASPFANAGDHGLGYINSDVTLYLHRLPVTRWIGFEVVNHHATDGIAIGECWLYDEKGPIGTSTVAALAQRKPMTNVPPP